MKVSGIRAVPWLAFVGMLLACLGASAGTSRPILAVFDLKVDGVALSAPVRDRTTDYLVSLVAARGYQVVPRSTIRVRLVEEKTRSYKDCFDTACQIELGKELAANKSLSAHVFRLANECRFSLTLFDLRTAASEAAATTSGRCDEAGIVASLEEAVQQLFGGGTRPAGKAASVPPTPAGTREYERLLHEARAIKEAEEAHQRARTAAWEAVVEVCGSDVIPPDARVRAVEAFLRDYPGDHEHSAGAEALRLQMKSLACGEGQRYEPDKGCVRDVCLGMEGVWDYLHSGKTTRSDHGETQTTLEYEYLEIRFSADDRGRCVYQSRSKSSSRSVIGGKAHTTTATYAPDGTYTSITTGYGFAQPIQSRVWSEHRVVLRPDLDAVELIMKVRSERETQPNDKEYRSLYFLSPGRDKLLVSDESKVRERPRAELVKELVDSHLKRRPSESHPEVLVESFTYAVRKPPTANAAGATSPSDPGAGLLPPQPE